MSSKTQKRKNGAQSFFKGAFILSLSMVAVKLCGLIYKIMLTRIYSTFGDQFAGIGTGLFGNAYELYNVLFTIASAGFPIAVSRLISESVAQKRYNDVRQVYKVSKPFFIIMGLICFVIMFFGSFIYVNIIKSPYSIYSMIALSPTIFFGCLISIYRGYYEGLRNMTPTAISEIVEAASKMIFGLSLAYLIMKVGTEQYEKTKTIFTLTFASDIDAMYTLVAFSVTGAIIGVTIGSFLAFLYLRLRFSFSKDKIPEEYYQNSVDARTKKETFNVMLKTAIPIGLAALVMSLSSTVDSALIQRVLYNMALNHREALIGVYDAGLINNTIPLSPTVDNPITFNTCLYGYYGNAFTIAALVTTVTQALGTTAMPSVTNAYTKGNKAELAGSINTVLRLTSLFTFAAGLGLTALAEPILNLIYGSEVATYGADSLRCLGVAIIFIAISTPICSMLQGVGKIDLPLKLYAICMVIKIIVTYLFVSVVEINVVGAAIGSLVAYIFVCVVGMYCLVKHTKIMPDFVSCVIKPLVGSVCCAAGAYFSNKLLSGYVSSAIATVISIVIAVIIYIIVLLLLRAFTANEIKKLPKGEKIAKTLAKLHLLG